MERKIMFITIEGGEGSGKTTQIENIKTYFEDRNIDYVSLKEPGGTKTGQKIRKILLDPLNDICSETEYLLYIADRSQNIKENIEFYLNTDKVILCDRYFDSSLVYQGFCKNIDISIMKQMHGYFCNDIFPHLTFLLDIDPVVGLKRAKKQLQFGQRKPEESRFEFEDVKFHVKVRDGYLALANECKERFKVIDASYSKNLVKKEILDYLDFFLEDYNEISI
jgi:dTMP kinase